MSADPTPPVSVGAAVDGYLSRIEEQDATCECGAAFKQQRNKNLKGVMAGWWPKKCAACERREQDQEVRTSQRRETERRLAALGVPPRYATAGFESFAPHGDEENKKRVGRVVIAARRFISDWPQPTPELLVFRGGPGTGKGHLAWAIARHLAAELGATVKFVKLPALIRDLREGWREGPSEGSRLQAYREPELLIVDEVSRHAFYGEPTQHLYDVLDDRMDWCRPTILTTNETEAGLAALLGPALLDRVVGYGGLLDFGDVSYRSRRPAA